MKRKLVVNVAYSYEVEVDDSDSVVKEYNSDKELVEDIVSYRFSNTLPVMQQGVIVKDIEVITWSIVNPNNDNQN